MTEPAGPDDGGRTPGEPASASKTARLHRYRVALVLFVLALALGVAAKVVLPGSAPVFVHGAILRITLIGSLGVSGVDLAETPMPGGTGVTLGVTLRAPQPEQSTPSERLVVAVPDPSPGAGPCPRTAISCSSLSPGVRTIYVRFPDRRWSDTGAQGASPYRFVLSVRVDLAGVDPNLVQDDQDVAAALPPVGVLQSAAGSTQPPVYESPVAVTYAQPVAHGGSYTWSDTAAAPETVGNSDVWSYLAVTDAPDALSPRLDSGVDLMVQGNNDNAVFLAGALLGIAGGALVAAVTEAIKA